MSEQSSTNLKTLHGFITSMDALSQHAFNQIGAISTLLLSYMETVEGQSGNEVIARAIECISCLASEGVENIGGDAESVNCGYEDERFNRRIAAAAESFTKREVRHV